MCHNGNKGLKSVQGFKLIHPSFGSAHTTPGRLHDMCEKGRRRENKGEGLSIRRMESLFFLLDRPAFSFFLFLLARHDEIPRAKRERGRPPRKRSFFFFFFS